MAIVVFLVLFVLSGVMLSVYKIAMTISDNKIKHQEKLILEDKSKVFDVMFDMLQEVDTERSEAIEVSERRKSIEEAFVDLHSKSAFCPNLTEREIRSFVKRKLNIIKE